MTSLQSELNLQNQFQMTTAAFPFRTIFAGIALSVALACSAADPASNSVPASASETAAGNSGPDDSLRAYLHLQEQIHEALLAGERNRQDSEEISARNAKALEERLQMIEKSLDVQRGRELDSIQHANRTMVFVVSAFAGLGCMAVLLAAFFQWRAVNRFTAVSSALTLGNSAASLRSFAGLAGAGAGSARLGPGDSADSRLLGAIERLEKRIQELERGSRQALGDAPSVDNILDLQTSDSTPAPSGDLAGDANSSSVSTLLGTGQSLLNAGKMDEAIACFDKALAVDSRNAEALVKKGTALERLRKSQEALDCYDGAIAIDDSMTIAYLYKGGLYNRLERFAEALACYEKALHTQEKRRAS